MLPNGSAGGRQFSEITVIQFLKWLFFGGRPTWLPSACYVDCFELGCTFTGATLPHGDWWWICVSIDRSGTKGKIGVRSAPLANRDQVITRSAHMPIDEIPHICELLQKAVLKKGRVTRLMDSVMDGFPADVRISLGGRVTKFRYNLVEAPKGPDARADLAKALFELGKMLIDKPSNYGACKADGEIIVGEA